MFWNSLSANVSVFNPFTFCHYYCFLYTIKMYNDQYQTNNFYDNLSVIMNKTKYFLGFDMVRL